MKSLLFKLLPGVVVTVGVIALASFASRAQNPNPNRTPESLEAPRSSTQENARAAAPTVSAPAYAVAEPVAAPRAAIVVCGHCGAQLEQPRAVLVAAPVDGWRAQGRRDAQPCREGIVYAAAYHGDTDREWVGSARVNPIPWPGNVPAYYPDRPSTAHRSQR